MSKTHKTGYAIRLCLTAFMAVGLVGAGMAACSGETSPRDSRALQTANADQAETSPLLGTWDISLYFSADAPPSATRMVIDAVSADGTLSGTFYDSPFQQGRFTLFAGDALFTVVTSDGTGDYVTSGRLDDTGMMTGQTLSTGRGFLMAWTGERG